MATSFTLSVSSLRVIHEHDVNGMFVAPTALRAIRREDAKADAAKKAGYHTKRCFEESHFPFVS